MVKNVKLGQLEDIGIWKHADQSDKPYFVSEYFDVPDIGAITRHTTRRCLSHTRTPMREQA